MAKTNGIFGDWSGKLGNVVGYRLKNSDNAVTQGVRAYQPDVYNPKTVAQAKQRIKVTAAVRFYKAFSSFLSFSYEGKSNDHACYCRQQSLALKMPLDNIPYLPKGAEFFVPAPYLVSEGSLPAVSVVQLDNRMIGQGVACSLRCSQPFSSFSSFGAFSAHLLQNNIQLQDGDTIFVIAAFSADGCQSFTPFFAGFTIDSTSSATPEQLPSLARSLQVYSLNGISYLDICPAAVAVSQLHTAAAAFTLCRGNLDKPHACKFSSATMEVSALVRDVWFSVEQYERAFVTYLPPSPALSDKLLNQAGRKPWAPITPAQQPVFIEYLKSDGEYPYFKIPLIFDSQIGFSGRVSFLPAGYSSLFSVSYYDLDSLDFLSGAWLDSSGVAILCAAGSSTEEVILYNNTCNFYINSLIPNVIALQDGPNSVQSLYNHPSLAFSVDFPLFASWSNFEEIFFPSTGIILYSFDIFRNKIPSQTLKPARIGSEGVLIDTLSNTVYHSVGEGNFILGPDIE